MAALLALAVMVAPAAAVLDALSAPALTAPDAPAPAVDDSVGGGSLYGARLADGLESEPAGTTVSLLVRLRGDPISSIILDYRARFGDQPGWPAPVVDSARAAIEARDAQLGAQRVFVLDGLAHAGVTVQPTRDYRYLVNGINLRGVPAFSAMVLAANREVVFVERDHEVFVAMAQSVPLINADDVWNLTDGLGRNITGRGTLIANIDTGVDYSHPDLGGTLNRTNDLANLTAGTHPKFASGWDFVNDDADPWDGHLHGTHVAGTIGANGTIVGVAPNSKQLALKVLSDAGYGGDSDIIAAMEYATDPDDDPLTNDAANASSMSLGGWDPNPDGLEPIAADQSTRLGTICVIAAGNSGATNSVGSPGVSRLAITVGSTTKSDVLSGFSSQGPTLGLDLKPDILAPGSSITSTRWGGAGGTLTISGTSMATPHVSGAIALIAQAHPNWTVNQTKSALVDTAVDLGYGVFQQGGGRMDVLAAVNTAVAATPYKVVVGRLDRLTSGTNTTVVLQNMGTSAVSLDLSARDLFGMTPALMYTGNTADLDYVTVSPSNVTIMAGGSATVTLTFAPTTSAVPGLYWGTLTAAGGIVSLRIPLAYAVRAPILVVDDDSSDRYGSAPAFDNFAGFPSATNNVSASLTRLGMKHDIFTAVHYTDDGPKLADLTQYPLVIWCTGYDYDYSDGYHTHRSISTDDRTELSAYLDRGGQLWLIGENIAWEVSGHQNATFAASNFFNAYLGVARVDNELNTPNPLTGTPGTFMNGTSYAVNPTWTEYGNKGDYATNLTPTARAFTIFNGSTTDVYGKTYANASLAVAVDNETYRSVFWGVEFSFLSTNAQFDDAVAKTMTFFAPRPTLINATAAEGQTLDLRGRYAYLPNPGVFTFAWSFGDNSTASTRNATHTFLDEGNYTVTFTITSGAWLNLTGSVMLMVVNLPPHLDSYVLPTNVTEGLNVTFSANCSDPGPLDTVGYWWLMSGTWTSDMPENPYTIRWEDDGVFNVSLVCFDEDMGLTITNFTVVVANADPVVGPLVFAGRPLENGTMFFSTTCGDLGFWDVLNITWSWGDGSQGATGQNASHVYADDGNYSVTATCQDDDGGSGSNLSLLRIGNVGPTVALAGNGTVPEGTPLALNVTVTDPGIFDTFTYQWDFGDGSPVEIGPAPGHRFADNGNFTVTLTVFDNAGDSGQANFSIVVTNAAPLASIEITGSFVEGEPFTYNITVSDPGTADTTTLFWGIAPAVTPSGLWADDGSYTLIAILVDDDGDSTTYSFNVTIANAPPDIRMDTYPVGSIREGYFVGMDALVSDPGPLDILAVTYDFHDGTPPATVIVANWRTDPHASVVHVFPDEGMFEVQVTVDDGDGGTEFLTFTVYIENQPPTIGMDREDRHVAEGTLLNLSALARDPGTADVVLVTWQLEGIPGVSTGENFSRLFEQEGTWSLVVTALDDDGATSALEILIVVENLAPTIVDLGVPTVLVQGAPWTFTAQASDPGPLDVVSFRWEWLDGSTQAGASVERSFPSVGVQRGTLVAFDEMGAEDRRDFEFAVENAVPTILLIATDAPLSEGREARFEAQFDNPGSEELSFFWQFSDGATSTAAEPLHSFVQDGYVNVTLTVSEPDGERVAVTWGFGVANAAPVLACIDCPTRVAVGSPLVLMVEAADPGIEDTFSFYIEWSGGQTSPKSTGDVSFVFNTVGAVDIFVTVMDSGGTKDSILLHIDVLPDADRDGQDDVRDLDDDNDGTPDGRDPAPLDPTVGGAGAFPWWLLLVLAAGAGTALFLGVRRRRRGGDDWLLVEVGDTGRDRP